MSPPQLGSPVACESTMRAVIPPIARVVREPGILQQLEQGAVEVELAAIGQAQYQVGEDRLAERGRFEDGAAVEGARGAVVYRAERPAPDHPPGPGRRPARARPPRSLAGGRGPRAPAMPYRGREGERLLSLSRAAACHHRDDGGYVERSLHHAVTYGPRVIAPTGRPLAGPRFQAYTERYGSVFTKDGAVERGKETTANAGQRSGRSASHCMPSPMLYTEPYGSV